MFRRGAVALAYCAFSFAVASPVAAQDPPQSISFFIAPWGDDSWPGTFEAPFATFTRARDAVRTLIAAGLADDVAVLLRGGVYRITDPIVFGLEDSCPDPYTITYAAYPDELPIISGGRLITGWTDQGNGRWSATLADVANGTWTFRELFVDGNRRQRARHPNTGFLLAAGPDPKAGTDTRTSFAFYPGDIPPKTDLVGGELVFLHDWNISRVLINHADHELGTLTLAEPIGPSAAFTIFSQQDHPRYAVENDLVLLDEPGEWYLNEQDGELTYFPMPDEDMNAVEAVAPVARELVVVRGDADSEQFVHNLRFSGIAFEHCAWEPPEGGYAGWQAGFYEWRDYPEPYEFPAAITFELVETCRIEDGRIAHVGGWGVMFGRSCRDCAFVGNVVTDVAGTGILIGEDPYRTEDDNYWWISRPDQAAQGNLVANNLIQSCAEIFHGGIGIWIGLANDTTVSHNLIRQLPQVGISVGWKWDDTPTPCWGNTIEYNHIHDVMLMLSDGGAIYTLGRQDGTVLHGNLIHDIPPNAGVNESNGVFCDQGSTNLVLDGNAIFNVARSPLRFHMSGFNIVSGNTLLLANEDTLPIGYITTDPEDIVLLDNEVRVADGSVSCGDPVFGAAPLAGIEPRYRASVLGAAEAYVAAIECLCLTCRGDVEGSSSIDMGDIDGFVATLLTDTYAACSDVNEDGAVDGLDIQPFVMLVIASSSCADPPTGACCEDNGSCSEATEAACTTADGFYQGDGTSCTSDDPCLQPTGVCCLCEQCEQLDEQACFTQGGTFFRLIALCEDVEPCPTVPVGACCLPDETCAVRTVCSCQGLGGLYLGDQTDCAAGTPRIYNASPGLPIDGSHVVTHIINVPDTFEVWDVNVQLDLPHTWVGDLRITLEHSGRTASLLDTVLYSGCSDDLVSIVLDDEGAGGSVQALCDLGPPGIFPSSPPNYTPPDSLGTFDGLDAFGEWTITIVDVYPAEDDGRLDSWALFIDLLDEELCNHTP